MYKPGTLFTIVVLIFCFALPAQGQYIIKGEIQLSEEWEPMVYLSAILALEDMHTISEDFILAKAKIDRNGKFFFSGNNLPSDDRLYRMHVCKKGDPPSTIIIGGQEENHLHLILNNNSEIEIISEATDALFREAKLSGHAGNSLLKEIRDIKSSIKQNLKAGQSREYLRSRKEEIFLSFADTCSHPLPALVALENIDMERSFAENKQIFQKIEAKWESSYSNWPYFREYKRKIDFLSYNGQKPSPFSPIWGIILAIFGLVLLFVGPLFRKNRIKKGEESSQNKLLALSLQERKVYKLISQGKSNKEISSELHIGVSTVKSHVHNIFKKLGLKSRRQVSEVDE